MSSSQTSTIGHTEASRGSNARPLSQQDLHPCQDVVDYVKAYAKDKPEVMAMWCFGIGFILGWKLKLW